MTEERKKVVLMDITQKTLPERFMIIRYFENLKIRKQMLVLMVLFQAGILIMGIYLFLNFYRVLEMKMVNTTDQVFSHIENEVMKYFESVEITAENICYLPPTQKLITTEDAADQYVSYKEIGTYGTSLVINRNIRDFYIYSKNRSYSFGTMSLPLNELKNVTLGKNEFYYSHVMKYDAMEAYKDKSFFAIVKRINNASYPLSSQYYGNIILILDCSFFDEICSRYGITEGSYTFIINNYNEIAGQKDPRINSGIVEKCLENSERLKNKDYNVLTYNNIVYLSHIKSIGNSGWRIVSVTPRLQYFKEMNNITVVTVLLFLLLTVTILSISGMIISGITKPIKGLLKAMENVGKGNFEIRCKENLKNELGKLASYFNYMMDEINLLMKKTLENQQKLYEARLVRKDAQLMALQSQINPHFLYNTLATIQSIATCYKVKEIYEISIALTRVMRYSIKEGDYVMLSAEIENLKSYLSIYKIKNKGKFDYTIEIDDEIVCCRIIKLIFQPIVENAVIHGVQEKIGNCRLAIKGRKIQEQLQFEIIDNGVGMAEDKVHYYNEVLPMELKNESYKNAKQSLGISNVIQRLELCYGDSYELRIDSCINRGTRVLIKIPYEGSDIN